MKNQSLLSFAAILLFISSSFFLTSCKSASSNPVTTGSGIGPSGGTVTSDDGSVTLVIPAGALTTTEMIAITANANLCPQGIGIGYSFTPNGLTFGVPVTLTLHYADSNLVGSNAKLLGVAYQDANSNWFGVSGGSVDTNAHSVTVPISHFSNWATYESYVLLPPTTMTLTGGTIKFSIVNTGIPVSGQAGQPQQLVPLGVTIIPDQWIAGGVIGGNQTVGTIATGLNKQGIYTAPSLMPSPNAVTIDAQIILPDLSKVILQRTVHIIAKDWLLEDAHSQGFLCPNPSGIAYVVTGGGVIDVHLGADLQVASVGSWLPGLTYGVTSNTICTPDGTTEDSVVLGKDLSVKGITGGYNASLNALVLNLDKMTFDQPGLKIFHSAGGVWVKTADNPVVPGNEVTGPVYFRFANFVNSKITVAVTDTVGGIQFNNNAWILTGQ